MEWRGRRESDNVEDRRGSGMKNVGTLGGGTIVIALIYTLLGGDPRVILNLASRQSQEAPVSQVRQNDSASRFVRVVLADTEDVWAKVFSDRGKTYAAPKLVLFTERVQSACGVAGSSVGPFYCPADQKLYLDLSFFDEMKHQLGASGDFAHAYVIAHEVGHHVQNLLKIFSEAQTKKSGMNKIEKNRQSVVLELQADCLAGIWAKKTDQMHHSLEAGDIEDALAAASAVGDDKLQKASRGYVVPDSFTHGSSAQRMASFMKGYRSADLSQCTASDQLSAID